MFNNLDNMSTPQLIETIIMLRSENQRLRCEVQHLQNRNSLCLMPHFSELAELKSRLDQHAFEIQALKEKK